MSSLGDEAERRSKKFAAALARTYSIFEKHQLPDGVDFCTFCHDQKGIDEFLSSSPRELAPDLARNLACEPSDHWHSVEAYKHYLPAILDRILPPYHDDALYPEHLFNTLDRQQFRLWDQADKESVTEVLLCAIEELKSTKDLSSADWCLAAMEFLERSS